jgi:hypothetical protein
MYPTTTRLLLAAAIAAISVPAVAQTFRTLPVYADVVDGHQSLGLPFGKPGFRSQILVSGVQLAATGASLNGIRFRADRWLAPPTIGTQVPNVTVRLSHTSVVALSSAFAANVTGPASTVFQGTVSLPAQGIGNAGPLPWNIVIPFSQPFAFTTTAGNLLVDIVGNNSAAGSPNYFLDAGEAGGAATQFGVSGDHPSFDNLLLFVATGNDLIARQLSPGHTIDFISSLFFTTAPGVLALGTTPQPVPIDLTPIGAPTNFLYLDPLLFVPHTWTPSPIGSHATFALVVPNNPAFVGATIYGQSAILVPNANPLGVITSHAVETRLGDEFEVFPMQQVDAPDPNAANGTLVGFGSATPPERGAVTIRFDGTFF